MQLDGSCTRKYHSDNQPSTPRVKVFGIGWAKTGTTTLGRCFEILGYNHQSQNLSLVPQVVLSDFKKTLRIAGSKESFEDWPWPLVYREMDAAFPGSLFVLTTRVPENWISSYRAMLAAQGLQTPYLRDIRCQLFGMDPVTASDEELVARYMRHNIDIMEYFESRSEQLLVVDWEAGDSWEKLCQHLKAPLPDVPFPHLNRRE
jgi:hypothetical protein